MPVGRSGSPAQQATSATQSPGHETRQLSRAALQPHMSCSRSAPPRREAKAASSHHAAPHQPPPLLAGHNDTGSHMSVTEPTIKICTKRGSSPAQEILRGGYCGAHAKVQNFFFTFFFSLSWRLISFLLRFASLPHATRVCSWQPPNPGLAKSGAKSTPRLILS